MTRLINISLVVATLVGAQFLARQRTAYSVVRQEHDRLSKQYGVLNVSNPDNFFVTYIENDDPFCFRWRVYDPPAANLRKKIVTKSGNSSSSSFSSDGGEALQLCRFKFEGTSCKVYIRDRSGSSTMSLGNQNLVQFLKDHWSELNIQVLGSDGPVEIDRDQVVRLITIRIPNELQDEFVKSAGKFYQDPKRQALPILDVYYGVK